MNPDIDTDVQRFRSTNTFHVEDYSEIVADALEPLVEGKRCHQQEVFPPGLRESL